MSHLILPTEYFFKRDFAKLCHIFLKKIKFGRIFKNEKFFSRFFKNFKKPFFIYFRSGKPGACPNGGPMILQSSLI